MTLRKQSTRRQHHVWRSYLEAGLGLVRLALPAYLRQLACPQPLHQRAEHPATVHGCKLAVVTGEDQPCPAAFELASMPQGGRQKLPKTLGFRVAENLLGRPFLLGQALVQEHHPA